MRKRSLIITFIIILGGLWLLGSPTFSARVFVSNGVANILESTAATDDLATQIDALERENAALRAQLSDLQFDAGDQVVVYSSYPFNNRSEIIIGVGANQGVEVNDVVTYESTILVGKIKQVFDDQSVVSTIFDPGFETAVRIGNGETDALMKGGNELKLEFVPEDAHLEVGDVVVTASHDFPYGLEVGRVKEISADKGGVFKKVRLDSGFEIQSLRYVDFPR